MMTFRINGHVDVENITAEMQNGLLRVKINRKPEQVTTLPVSSAPISVIDGGANIALAFPGFGSEHVTATIVDKRSSVGAVELIITGDRNDGGSSKFRKMCTLPRRVNAEEARASMVNGIFSFTAPITPLEVKQVQVLNEMPKADDSSQSSTVTVFSLPMPGLAADAITAETKGNRLVLTNKKDSGAMMEMDLPNGLKDIQLSIEHGVLRVHAHKDKPHTVQVVTTASAA